MTTCLSDDRIQAVADREATPAEDAHIAACARCRERVEAVRQAVESFGAALNVPVPPALEARVAQALDRHRSDAPRGATTLRPEPVRAWMRPAWISAAAIGAVALIAFVLQPAMDRSSQLSAAEIIDRSIAALAPAGTELLEYELSLTTPAGWTVESGTYRIEQVIEHQGAGRWRLARFDAAGTLLNGISEDPPAGRRRAFVRVDGVGYAFDFETTPDVQVRLGDMQRQYAEAAMRVIQTATGQVVRTEEDGSGKRFVIELPEGASAAGRGGPALLWALSSARLVADASDYHVRELTARGVYMGQPVSVSYRLLRRDVRDTSQVPPSEFELPIDSAAITIHARGTAHPPEDVLTALLREVAQLRR